MVIVCNLATHSFAQNANEWAPLFSAVIRHVITVCYSSLGAEDSAIAFDFGSVPKALA